MAKKVKFAFITDGDVFQTFSIDDVPAGQQMIMGLRSEPIVIEITDHEDVDQIGDGWRYVNGNFIKES